MTPFADFHTHNLLAPPGALISLPPEVVAAGPGAFRFRPGVAYSVGLHPWQVSTGWPALMPRLQEWLALEPVQAVGECGLDRLCAVPRTLQCEAFAAQLELAARAGKWVVVHCVRGWDDLWPLLRRAEWPEGHVVIHGFRGKPEQLRQLLAHGCGVSFGPRFNALSLRACPPARRHAETDNSGLGIEAVLALHRQALEGAG